MKKKSLVLFPLLFLMGCGEVEAQSSYFMTFDSPLPVLHLDSSKHVTYLLLSRYGRLSVDGKLIEGGDIPEKYYENCVAYEASAGSDLPVAVSTLDDVEFTGWAIYQNNIYYDIMDKVPEANGTFLCATFKGPTGGSGGAVTEGYGFKFTDGTKVAAVDKGEESGYHQYLVSDYTFTAGKSFALYDFGMDTTWVIDVDPYSFGGADESSTKWKTYLSLSKDDNIYTVLQTFKADVYIKLKYEADNIYFGLK